MNKAIGPKLPVKISPSVLSGNMLFATNIPDDLSTGQVIPGDAAAQALQCFNNLKTFVETAGGTLEDIVQITVYLVDAANVPAMSKAYEQVFANAKPPYPTRATVIVPVLARPGMLIETTAHAIIGSSKS